MEKKFRKVFNSKRRRGAVIVIVLTVVLAGIALNSKKNNHAESMTDGTDGGAAGTVDVVDTAPGSDADNMKEEQTGLYEEGDINVSETELGIEGEEIEGVTDDTLVAKQPHRDGWQDVKLVRRLPEYLAALGWDENVLSQEESDALAQQALQELYDLTGTRVEECYYFYSESGTFSFALTEADIEKQRCFYSRTFGEETKSEFFSIPSMQIANARRVWYSPVQQYELPEGYEEMAKAEQAVWFLMQSALYHGAAAEECIPEYEGVPGNWKINMADGTAYLVQMDEEIDTVTDITGPYPDGEINH